MWCEVTRNWASEGRSLKTQVNSKRREELSKYHWSSRCRALELAEWAQTMIWIEARGGWLVRDLMSRGKEGAWIVWGRAVINKAKTSRE